jgi:hypothetical protein
MALLASANGGACRIRANGPHWIEVHGHAKLQRIAGGPMGLLAIGTNALLYSYPEFGSVWHEWNNRLRAQVVVGSRRGLVYAEEGRVGQGNHGRVGAPEWTLGGAVTALATDEDGDALYAVAAGHISRLLATGAAPGPCSDLHVVSIALAQGQLWVSDAQHIYSASDTGCAAISGAPAKVTRLAGLRQHLLALNEDGDVFRRGPSGNWEQLPRPTRFRPDQMPQLPPAQDIAVTGTAEWLLDDEQNVFVLSESE